ncbi:hypothetical protein N7447_008195 [Penicillium robsamsonii]|uniref:uncharacterized protein n=1 Tax=Penicillium robsamsonii TaxID=1792511 RepID=UPI002548EDB5|nr:uncharacterized protein N7447_008195 [Penicillium robsamsonii]KAJ5815962.1 hypothetical protein N7447_008195 [Penicillium robsamsonii]
MAPRTYLTTGLRHLPKPRTLEPGEALLVRYKNSLRQYKSDVWIGVPTDGAWVTHPKDRIYSMYLPGRNMYKWVGLQDLFVLKEKTINVLRRAQREPDAKIWDDILEIVRSEPGLEKNMALQELGTKGKRGKELRFVLPSGHEDLVSCGESHADFESEKEEDGDEDENKEAPSDHAEPATPAAPGSSNI